MRPLFNGRAVTGAHTHTWRDGRSARRLANAAPLMVRATDGRDPPARCSLLLPLSLQASVGGSAAALIHLCACSLAVYPGSKGLSPIQEVCFSCLQGYRNCVTHGVLHIFTAAG
ncbi:MAG: hypothetical protein ACPIOQ_67550, partial [Promethearchaeia archaeon]